MMVPFSRPEIDNREIAAVTEVLKSGWLTRGKVCQEFETKFSEYTGAKHSISLNSGTAALHLALLAHGIGPGDRVIVPSMTFPATVNAILYVGAIPVLVDCSEEYNLCMPKLDLEEFAWRHYLPNKECIKALIGVDMHGLPCSFPFYCPDIPCIRDAAHSVGASTHYGKVGGMETTCFSFYTTKNMTTGGEGGMLTTNDDEVAEKVRRLSLHGMDKDAWKRYEPGAKIGWDIPDMGYKYNMSDIQAAMGIVQLEKLDQMLDYRMARAAYYHTHLSRLASRGKLTLPGWKPCWHVYAIRVDNRDKVAEELKSRGIGCGIHFRPCHDLPYLKQYIFGDPEVLYPNATKLGQQTLSLPLYPSMTTDDIDVVVEALEEILV